MLFGEPVSYGPFLVSLLVCHCFYSFLLLVPLGWSYGISQHATNCNINQYEVHPREVEQEKGWPTWRFGAGSSSRCLLGNRCSFPARKPALSVDWPEAAFHHSLLPRTLPLRLSFPLPSPLTPYFVSLIPLDISRAPTCSSFLSLLLLPLGLYPKVTILFLCLLLQEKLLRRIFYVSHFSLPLLSWTSFTPYQSSSCQGTSEPCWAWSCRLPSLLLAHLTLLIISFFP